MGVAEIITAIPTSASGGSPDGDLLRTELIAGVVGFIPDDATVTTGVMQVDPVDASLGGVRQAYVFGDGVFKYDELDETTAHDGITCLVLIGGHRYKILGDITVKAVESKTVTAPPDPDDVDPEDRPIYGDAYIVPAGTWDQDVDAIAVWTSRGGGSWVQVEADYGPPLYVKDTDSYVHWAGDSGWVAGIGSGSHPADTIPLSAIIGLDASFMLKVENQTIYAPPGSRKTGATPTVPLGGTAANINDDDDDTTSVTSALGDLTGEAVADRIVAQLALSAATDLIAIEVKDILGSAASTALAMGLYYSTDGATWTQAGAGFTLSTSAQDVIRSGDFQDVTHIALVTEAKNWSTNTHTLSGLNAYDATVECNVGDSWIVGSNPFGFLAGLTGKVVICEVEDTLTSYTPAAGDEVFDNNLNIPVRWSGTAWTSAAGSVVGFFRNPLVAASTALSVGSGSGYYAFSPTTAPTTGTAQRIEPVDLIVQAPNDQAKLEFRYQGVPVWATQAASVAAHNPTIALFRDNLTDAIAWHPLCSQASYESVVSIDETFIVDAPDDQEHNYRVSIFYGAQENLDVIVSHMARREFTCKILQER